MKEQNSIETENKIIINEYRSLIRAISNRANSEEKKKN